MLAPVAHELEHAVAVLLLLALRIVPGMWWLAWTVRSATLSLWLGLATAVSLWPLALRIAPPGLGLSTQLWAAVPWELARGLVLGLGGLLPLLALGWAGRLSDVLRDVRPTGVAGSALEGLYGAAALAVLFASGGHALVLRPIVGSLSELPLGSGSATTPAVQALVLELAKLLARAFELGVVLAAPVLLVVFSAALLLGLSARVSVPLAAALLRGPLLPVLGLSAACLCISSILGEYPQLAQVFVDTTRSLLPGLR